MSAQLIKRMRELRMQWLDLQDEPDPGRPLKRLRIIRPTEVQLGQSLVKGGRLSVGVEDVERFAVDWEGFTEADLLGPAVGSSDPVPFSQEVWAEYVSDKAPMLRRVAEKLLDIIVAHSAQSTVDTKNS